MPSTFLWFFAEAELSYTPNDRPPLPSDSATPLKRAENGNGRKSAWFSIEQKVRIVLAIAGLSLFLVGAFSYSSVVPFRNDQIRPDLPVVLTSGYLPPEEQAKAKGLGIRHVVTKPVNARELRNVLAAIFRERSDFYRQELA
jgi:response regulator RpfG family c-di-GMP phosphodiesterase